jgi:hypothetical protein
MLIEPGLGVVLTFTALIMTTRLSPRVVFVPLTNDPNVIDHDERIATMVRTSFGMASGADRPAGRSAGFGDHRIHVFK